MKKNIIYPLVILFALSTGHVAAEIPAVNLSIQEKWSCVFGGEKETFHAVVSAGKEFSGRLTWRFSKGRRTISRGERNVDVTARAPEVVAIPLPVPSVNPGVILDLTLTVTITGLESDRFDAETEKTIHAFSAQPFFQRLQWLEDLDIHFFDPDDKTAGILDDAEVKYTKVNNIEAIRGLEDAVVVIGEGVSFVDYRGLPEIIIEAAAAGSQVLCLAPSEGEFALPDPGDALQLESISLLRSDVIGQIKKRLDSGAWPPDGRTASAGLVLGGYRGAVTAAVVEPGRGWPWLDIKFDGGGRLIVCGFALMEKWDTGPVPRFLFAEILLLFENAEIKNFSHALLKR